IASEGAAETARLRRIHHLGSARDRREREPAAERLAGDEEVRLDAVVLDRPHGPRAAHPALDLVGNIEGAMLGAELLEPARKVGRHRDEAALALDGFEHDAADLVLAKERC